MCVYMNLMWYCVDCWCNRYDMYEVVLDGKFMWLSIFLCLMIVLSMLMCLVCLLNDDVDVDGKCDVCIIMLYDQFWVC